MRDAQHRTDRRGRGLNGKRGAQPAESVTTTATDGSVELFQIVARPSVEEGPYNGQTPKSHEEAALRKLRQASLIMREGLVVGALLSENKRLPLLK